MDPVRDHFMEPSPICPLMSLNCKPQGSHQMPQPNLIPTTFCDECILRGVCKLQHL